MTLFRMCLCVAAFVVAVPAVAQESENTNMEILKQKVKADKKLLVASNMNLSDAEAKGFWPLYEGYQKELESINQRLISTIKTYAEAYNAGKGDISNETAKKLMGEALGAEEAEVRLRQSYAGKLEKVLPPTKAARYLQIENKIRALVKFDLAGQIPLVN